MMDKKEARRKILDFFSEIERKNAEEVNKIKRLAMSFSIRLEDLRKKFCRKCYSPLVPGVTSRVKIKNKIKSTKCNICSYVNRWKLESEAG